ncbi:hypothetical protein CH365_08190 [Leptospira neocaledonica]|uniref:Peptidase S8/S53 domain-containing protein n=2 Tax=Leptospira neocaledonica TaxID=2023192 RepID=A0A2N0A0A4_9LEPT|nr:hypothetical protein CH365_08190 [Leptospira neocaledonica]
MLETDFSSLIFIDGQGYTFTPQISLKESNLSLPFVQGLAIVKFKTVITKSFSEEGYAVVGLESTDLILKKYECGEIFPISDSLGELDTEASSAVGLDRTYLLVFKEDRDILEALFELSADPNVESVSLNNFVDSSETVPNDPAANKYGGFGREQVKYLDPIRAYDGWDITKGSPDITIAVIDTGIDDGHPDLAGRVIQGPSIRLVTDTLFLVWDKTILVVPYLKTVLGPSFIPKLPLYYSSFHGTHVAGIIGATANNSLGGVGLNWNSKILSIPVFDYWASENDLRTTDLQVGTGILEAARRGAKVINMSLGGEGFFICQLGCLRTIFSHQTEKDAVAYAYAKRIVLVASAGNETKKISPFPGTAEAPGAYPASFPEVISVSALSYGWSYNQLTYFSNYGKVDVAAPGDLIYSTTLQNSYIYAAGTSMAAPMVSALAGLVLSLRPELHPSIVKEKICNNATSLGTTAAAIEKYGCGRLNVGNTLITMNSEFPPPQITSNCGAPGQPACWAGMYLAPWSHQFTATDGLPPYTWSVVSGRLPGAAGSTQYNTNTGYMWGPATFWWGPGWTFEMKVTDARGNSDIRSFYFISTL